MVSRQVFPFSSHSRKRLGASNRVNSSLNQVTFPAVMVVSAALQSRRMQTSICLIPILSDLPLDVLVKNGDKK